VAHPPIGSEKKPNARLIPQAVGGIADVAAVSALLTGGGEPIVLVGSLGAILAGSYIVWKRWGGYVDRTLVAGVTIAAAGSGVFGYALTKPSAERGAASSIASAQDGATDNGRSPGSHGQLATSRSVAGPAISNDTEMSPVGPKWLVDIKKVDGGSGWESGTRTVNAKIYEHSVVGSTCSAGDDANESFNLGRQFQRFQATVGMADDTPTGAATQFTVIVDDKQIFNRDVRLGEQAVVDVSVAGGLRLVLHVESVRYSQCSSKAVWGDASLR
jgi:hypothetical protein